MQKKRPSDKKSPINQPMLKLANQKSFVDLKSSKDDKTPFSKVRMAQMQTESSGSSIEGEASIKRESRRDLIFINNTVLPNEKPIASRKSVILVPAIQLAGIQEADNDGIETR
jgi:hypothetical protein